PLGGKFGHDIGDQRFDALDFLDAADHRKQNAYRMVAAHAQKRAELRLQQRRVLEQQPHAPLGKRWIARRRQREVGELFVGADVEETQSDGPGMETLGRAFEVLVLLIFGGKGRANQKTELGSVEADAVGLVEERRFGVGELVYVGEQHDRRTVGGY